MSQFTLPPKYAPWQTFFKTFRLVNKPIEVLSEGIQRFGDTFAFSVLVGKDIIITQNPDFVDYVLKGNHRNYNKSKVLTQKLGRFLGQGLLTSNGAYWLRQRRLIQPGFHRDRIHNLYGIVQEVIDSFLDQFPTGTEVDVYPLTNKLAFRIAISSLFNITLPESTLEELSRFVSEVQSFVVKDIRQPYKSWWHVISGQEQSSLYKAQKARVLIREIIQERKASKVKRNDLLDMLLETRYEDTGLPMELEQMIDEIMILVIAGHETSANALAWTLYLLGQNPQHIQRIRDEVGPDIDDCIGNAYLAAVIKESMRLYPPAWIMDRVALEDDSFGGYSFPAGTIVTQFIYGIHHSEKYWPQPEIFNPNRFMDEKFDKVLGHAYFPFGAGPRLCIGSNFAMGEMALFLKSLLTKYTIQKTDQVPVKLAMVTLRPDRVLLNVSKV